MVDKKLADACKAVDSWCSDNKIEYDIASDNADLQGIMIFKRDRDKIPDLIEKLQQTVDDNIHIQNRKVRGGNVIILSLKALSESEAINIVVEAGEELEAMTFKERIEDAFNKRHVVKPQPKKPAAIDIDEQFARAAAKIAEAQMHTATAGMNRANQTGRLRHMFGTNVSTGGVKHGQKGKGEKKETKTDDIKESLFPAKKSPALFTKQLNETLSGMATPSGAQPADLFQKFAKALEVLGTQMGVGPLQNKLKEQGINWRKSDDGSGIILYVINGQTNAPQPIFRISAETLEKPNEFEEQLFSALDFSKGEAPGAFKQKQQEIQAQEKAVREIAKQVSPQPNPIEQQMNGQPAAPAAAGAPAAAPAVAPAAPAAAPAAPAAPAPAAPKPPVPNQQAV